VDRSIAEAMPAVLLIAGLVILALLATEGSAFGDIFGAGDEYPLPGRPNYPSCDEDLPGPCYTADGRIITHPQ